MIRTEQAAARVRTLLDYWGVSFEDTGSRSDLLGVLVAALDAEPTTARAWETLSSLNVSLPTRDEVLSFRRSIRLNGAETALDRLAPSVVLSPFGERHRAVTMTDKVLVDVGGTASSSRTTGIQRVVREVVRRWVDQGLVTPVSWSPRMHALRLLTPEELDGVLGRATVDDDERDYNSDENADTTLVVPLGGTFIEAELIVQIWQTDSVAALGQFSSGRLAAIGYDTVPITSSETSDSGIVERFPLYLDALAWADRLGAISNASAAEFRGWQRMLKASGRSGPEIQSIFLAAETTPPTDADIEKARSEIAVRAGEPLVLVVGSHEPRKNHLAVLHAAERLWAAGESFRLCFMGGSAWGNDRFRSTAKRLQSEGRPLVVMRKVSDGLLAAGYHLADFSVFPSINEGFGLPVVESLTAGTPVITSDFGSMKEIADHFGGVVTVNPRSDAAIEAAMASLLRDPARREELAQAAASTRPKTWDQYAAELFDYLVPASTTAQTAAA